MSGYYPRRDPIPPPRSVVILQAPPSSYTEANSIKLQLPQAINQPSSSSILLRPQQLLPLQLRPRHSTTHRPQRSPRLQTHNHTLHPPHLTSKHKSNMRRPQTSLTAHRTKSQPVHLLRQLFRNMRPHQEQSQTSIQMRNESTKKSSSSSSKA